MFESAIGTPLLWSAFFVVILVMLALDLGVFHRHEHVVRTREAALWTAVWIGLSLLFNAWIWWQYGSQPGLEFLTGYVIEKSLSVDNIFVFIVIFQYFRVPEKYHHRVLFWGILGALLMRGIFIGIGAALISRFEWVLYIFGAFLVYTGIKVIKNKGTEIHPEDNPVLGFFRRVVPLTNDYRGKHFVVHEAGRWFATPLLLVLVMVEATDVVFAVDSIPAIFGVTRDPFIVFTSNIFAILGLRALYFLLADLMGRFEYLPYGLGLVLTFIGAKMLVHHWVEIPIEVSLAVVVLVLGGSIAASLLFGGKETEELVEEAIEAAAPDHPTEPGPPRS
ncbi:MAG TPA: TerC family protein [Thermoanaerobaculia bacterium]|nr:TerC family protein [Thermoanaerobaculia bacterium]